MEAEDRTPSNDVSPEELALLSEEERILRETLESLGKQLTTRDQLLKAEDRRSRTLTAELVAATRDEDKQMLASDEAVSHAIKQNHSGEAKSLTRLLEKPYFARFIVEEETGGTRPTKYEYKLGYSSNPECRIIDWRKSPLAKIYYEYQAGDEFCEEIQGKEREGHLVLKHPIRIESGELKTVTTEHGTFALQNGAWVRTSTKALGRGGIKSVLPLITPEQFQTITEDAKTAVLIQGIAGSGKTTVALHRLAWLLHENNSDFSSEECAIIVRNEVLSEFIRHTLAAIEIEGVPVYTFDQWQQKIVRAVAPDVSLPTHRSDLPTPPRGLTVFAHAEQFFENFEAALKKKIPQTQKSPSLQEFVTLLEETFLSSSTEQGTFLKLGMSPAEISNYLRTLQERSMLSPELTPAFLRYLLEHERTQPGNEVLPPLRFQHLVVDELQDYSLLSLSCLINAVKETRDLTLVGDVGQALAEDYDFVGWERLKEVWDIDLGEHAKFFTLEVSHRSSLPIMRLASHVGGRPLPEKGRQGRVPIWFHCMNEQKATASALDWLQKALERFPDALSAVLCRDHATAAQLYSLLKPSFGPLVRLGKHTHFSFEEGLVVTAIDNVKGLEFTNVLIWNPTFNAFPKGDRLAKNRLYVAMTRAEENLCLVTWNRYSSLLPSTHSKLVRGYDYRDTLDEE
jgi:DNA helicase-2/ATP-dependent DNA helicase PcrA